MQSKRRGAAPHSSFNALKPALLAVAMGCFGNAWAVDGGTIVAGDGSIAIRGDRTTVTQSSDKMIVNWSNFDIGATQRVDIRQPGATSAVLNRVTSAKPTEILGTLNANGRVFVVNPNGVLFGRTAKVDVGALVSSSLDTSDKEFMAGGRMYRGNAAPGSGAGARYVVLEGDGKGAVRNEGRLKAREAVVLGGPQVSNQGSIRASNVVLQGASGIAVRMEGSDFAVIPTRGELNALAENGGVIVANGGNIALSAAATGETLRTVVRNTGVLEATTATVGQGGSIELTAPINGAISIDGTVKAQDVLAMASTIIAPTDVPAPTLDYIGVTVAANGHDVGVEAGGKVKAARSALFKALDGNVRADGRIDAKSIWLGGNNIATRGPLHATSDVNVHAAGDVVQEGNITADTAHVFIKGRNIHQVDGVHTTAGDYVKLEVPAPAFSTEGRGGRVRAANIEAKRVDIVGNTVELSGRVRADGDIVVTAKPTRFVCEAGPDQTCLALYSSGGQLSQQANLSSRNGSIRLQGGSIDQAAGTWTRAAQNVDMKADSSVHTGNVEAGNRIDIAATSAYIGGSLSAPTITLPERVTSNVPTTSR